MSLVVVGLNHRTVPVELLERMAVAPEALPKALHALARRASTSPRSCCSPRATAPRSTRAPRCSTRRSQDVRHFLADTSGVDPDEFADLLYTYHDDAAVAHLFGVAAGLDSMIIGEGEILGQVREAWRIAEHESASGPLLSRTFRHAIEVGKRARTETGDRPSRGVGVVGRGRARRRAGSARSTAAGCSCSAPGEMGEGMAARARRRGRRRDRGRQPHAERRPRSSRTRVGGRAIALDDLPDALVDVDVLLSSTGAHDVLVERGDIEAGDGARATGGRCSSSTSPCPATSTPARARCSASPCSTSTTSARFGEQSLQQRRQEIGNVREIIAEELDRYRIERSAREVAPLVTALRADAEEIRRAGARAAACQARRPSTRRSATRSSRSPAAS